MPDMPAASPAASPPAPAAISPEWKTALALWLQAHKTYPDAARRRGEEGTALVRFTVDRAGHVLAVTLLQGTGAGDLDDAVRRMLRDASLPAFPPAMIQPQTTVTLRIRYALEP